MQKITPFLWFDSQAEEAANFYTTLFKNSRVLDVTHYGDAGPGPAGSVMTVSFELDGQRFVALNGGPHFQLNEAVSFVIDCDSQSEVDYYWYGLTEDGGAAGACGWCRDRFGLWWQVVPRRLIDLVTHADRAAAARATTAMLAMTKIDIAALEAAFAGE